MCSTPLPEVPTNLVLTRMLALVPYQMPAKGGKVERTKDGLHPEGASAIVSGGTKIPSSEDKNEGEVNASSPHGKKRAASVDWEEKARKRGKMPLSGGSCLEDVDAQSHDEEKPRAKL